MLGHPSDPYLSLCSFYSPRKPVIAFSFQMWPTHQNPAGSSQLWIILSSTHSFIQQTVIKLNFTVGKSRSSPCHHGAYNPTGETDNNQIITIKCKIPIVAELWVGEMWYIRAYNRESWQFRSSGSHEDANRISRSYGGKEERKEFQVEEPACAKALRYWMDMYHPKYKNPSHQASALRQKTEVHSTDLRCTQKT